MPWTARFEDAFVFAARLHRRQTRKASQVPYITHLMAVAALVGEAGGTEDEAIAALLHDAAEDQGGEPVLAEIRERFGESVARVVAECSDDLTGRSPKPPWKARKEAYIEHLSAAHPSSQLVCLADKVHNARSILADLRVQGVACFEKFSGGLEGTLWYYREIADRFRGRPGCWLSEELDRTVREIEHLARQGSNCLTPSPPEA